MMHTAVFLLLVPAFVAGQQTSCWSDQDAQDYKGTVSVTVNGIPCQRWDEQTPHKHNYNVPEGFPVDDSVSAADNYCRNPDGENYDGGPWCYTTDPDVRWEKCPVPQCSEKCWVAEADPYAQDYMGTVAVTVSGNTCQRWDEQTPHHHNYNVPEGFPVDDSVSAADNYCRNPDGENYDGGPWCYTTDPDVRWEKCTVPQCSECWVAEADPYAQDYMGTVAVTVSGNTCQRWDEQTPHKHNYNVPEGFPVDESVSAADNYCRNPDGENYDGGPWCYTTDPDVRWGNCPVSRC